MTTEFPERSFVLAKVKGYPEWPALVISNDEIPESMLDKKPKTRLDSICVKFYFDDKYLWCNSTNIKLIDREYIRNYLVEAGEEVPAGHEDFIDNQAGRRKRIVSAYLKAYTLPIDEFIKWGSWGEPKQPELDELDELDELEDLDEDDEEVKPKPTGRGRGRPKRSETTNTTGRGRKRKIENPAPPKPTGAKRGRKKKQPIVDIPIIDNEDDEDFVEGEEYFEDDEAADSDGGLSDDEEDEDDEPIANIDKDWGIIEQENKSTINFNLIPDSKVLANEVATMTSWCWGIRYEIQEMLFPDETTKLKDFKRKQLALDVKRMLKEEAEKLKLPPSASIEPEVKEEQPEQIEQLQQPKEEELKLPPLNYKSIKKTLDEIILQIIDSDISKSVLRSTGLNKIILIVLKTPELQSANTSKLQKWWAKTYSYQVEVDNRWSPTFTNKMHEFEEAARREAEEEKRRKRKEERKSTPILATTETSEVPHEQ